MADTVLLHIGAMKSGTSFIQRTLGSQRDELAEQGFLFPGRTWRKQVLAVLDALHVERGGAVVAGSRGAWPRLVEEVAAHDGTAVISMEFLGPTPPEDIRRVLDSLRPADVHVVMTVRDLGRNIPAMWQEELQNRATWRWADYLDELEQSRPGRPGGPYAKRFWRHMNFPFIARKWVQAVGGDRFALVTVPHPGADARLLWERFCDVAGLDPAPFGIAGPSNASLGAASAQVLRALNEVLPSDLPLRDYQRIVKHQLAKRGMAPRAAKEDRIGFDAPWVADRSARQIARLANLGVRVVGDLTELEPVRTEGVDPDRVPAELQLEAAVSALGHLVGVWPRP